MEGVTEIEQAQQNSASVPWLRLWVSSLFKGSEGSGAVKGHVAVEGRLHAFISSVQDGGVC